VDTDSAIAECKRISRELRRLKFMVDGPQKGLVAALERLCHSLLKRAEKMKERK
jgi:signal transduction histidine kinase